MFVSVCVSQILLCMHLQSVHISLCNYPCGVGVEFFIAIQTESRLALTGKSFVFYTAVTGNITFKVVDSVLQSFLGP